MANKKRSNKKQKVVQNGYSFDPMAVTWTGKYSASIDKYWSKLPNFLAKFLATLAIFVLGTSLKGM